MLIQGTPFADELFGTEGDDTIIASTGADRVEARGGNDEIRLTFAHDFEWSDWVYDGRYDGGPGPNDALYADWSAASAPIVWETLANATVQSVDGSRISNVERLLLRTGDGNDNDMLRNAAVSTRDGRGRRLPPRA